MSTTSKGKETRYVWNAKTEAIQTLTDTQSCGHEETEDPRPHRQSRTCCTDDRKQETQKKSVKQDFSPIPPGV